MATTVGTKEKPDWLLGAISRDSGRSGSCRIDLREERMVRALVMAALHVPAMRLGPVILGMLGLDMVPELLRRHTLRMCTQDLPQKFKESQPRKCSVSLQHPGRFKR